MKTDNYKFPVTVLKVPSINTYIHNWIIIVDQKKCCKKFINLEVQIA